MMSFSLACRHVYNWHIFFPRSFPCTVAVLLASAFAVIAANACVSTAFSSPKITTKQSQKNTQAVRPPLSAQHSGSTAQPQTTIFRTIDSIVIDGVLNEASWQQAELLELLETETAALPNERTNLKLLWNDSYLYVAFVCNDMRILSTMTERDALLWKEDVVEIFLAAGGLEETFGGYVEIEVNPRATILDLLVLRAENETALSLPYNTYNLSIQAASTVDGVINDTTQRSRSWAVEMAIPLKELRRIDKPALPQHDDVWQANFLRLNYRRLASANNPLPDRELSAWSPTMRPKFHIPERFGRLIFSSKPVSAR
jgi:hypothetical protein